jgi:hypothetical protein
MDQVARVSMQSRRSVRFALAGRVWCCICLLVTALLPDVPAASGQQNAQRNPLLASEYEVKAAFLLNFTKFIAWPAAASPPDHSFPICVYGEDPFGKVLDQIVEGERVDNRPVTVRRISGSFTGPCRILFVGQSERDARKILAEVPQGVLTVGDDGGFLHQGGMIGLAVENRRVRFDVDLRAAARAGLRVSSRLLSVARSVENQGRQ